MWPSSEKTESTKDMPSLSGPGHKWVLAEGKYGNAPLIVRFNNSAREWIGHPKMPIKLGFAIPVNRPTRSGLPHPDENEQMNSIEDIILRTLNGRIRGIHVLSLTSGTMKEFVFYVNEDADFQDLHESIQDYVPTHEVQCMAVREPDWDSYREFAPQDSDPRGRRRS